MRRMRRRRSKGPSKRRSLEWIGYNTIDGVTGRPNKSVVMTNQSIYANYILSPDEMTTLYDEPTLLRSIVRWSCSTTNSNVLNGQTWFFGWGLVALDVEAAGGTLPGAVLPYIPLPFFDSDTDWIFEYHASFTSGQQLVATTLDAVLEGTGQQDIRARRRFPNGHGLALICYFDSDNASLQLNASFSGRLLFANH